MIATPCLVRKMILRLELDYYFATPPSLYYLSPIHFICQFILLSYVEANECSKSNESSALFSYKISVLKSDYYTMETLID